MGKVATGGGEPRELIPARNYTGVVCGIYDIGTQTGGQFGPNSQFVIMFELHTRRGPARDSKANVFTISTFVNFYLGSRSRPANLLKLVEVLEGRTLTDAEIKAGYDVEKLLGKCCQVQVIHEPNAKGEMKAKVGATMPLDPDDDAPKGELDEVYYEITADRTIPESLPKFVQDFIKKSKEFGGGGQPADAGSRQPVGAGVGAKDDEDIPF
jgi:hypothetical protein